MCSVLYTYLWIRLGSKVLYLLPIIICNPTASAPSSSFSFSSSRVSTSFFLMWFPRPLINVRADYTVPLLHTSLGRLLPFSHSDSVPCTIGHEQASGGGHWAQYSTSNPSKAERAKDRSSSVYLGKIAVRGHAVQVSESLQPGHRRSPRIYAPGWGQIFPLRDASSAAGPD